MKTLNECLERNTIVMTNGINARIKENNNFSNEIKKCLDRHFNNDFGELSEEDIHCNLEGVSSNLVNDRVLSKYKTSEDYIYIITELYNYDGIDILTTILFPEEY